MSVAVSLAQILRLAPNVRSSYRKAFEHGQTILDQYEISASSLRVAHFMAQILHESGALTIQFENLNYSAKRLPQVWPTRFKPKGSLDPEHYANNPQKLANEVYGKRMGNIGPNDGFTYRGRGLMQLTGRESYREAKSMIRQRFPHAPDFEATPDEVLSSEWCLIVAATEWHSKGCNSIADNDDLNKVTRRINGGLNGFASREDWLRRTKALWK